MTKDDWEKPTEHYILTTEKVQIIAESVFPDGHVLSFERLGNGFSNSNYKVSLDVFSSPLVVRFYSGNRGIAVKEQSIFRMVSQKVPVAAYLHVDESCTIADVPFAIMEWKDGVLLSELMRGRQGAFHASAAETVGETLAEIHKNKFSESGFLNGQLEIEEPLKIGEESFISLIRQFIYHHCGPFLGERISDELLAFCRIHGHNLSEDAKTPVLVHSDYNGLNILMTERPGGALVSAILDWEYAYSGSRFADIGNMLRYEKEGSDFETHFLSGYEGGGGILKDNWRILSKLHDLVALCDLLNRSSSETPRRVQDLKYLISQAIR